MAGYEKQSCYYNAYTTSEILFPSVETEYSCLTIDPTKTHISRATNAYKIHGYYNQLCFEEGDYNIDLTYDWRIDSLPIINYYSDTGSNTNISLIKATSIYFEEGSSRGFNIDADGTLTILDTLHSAQTPQSSTVLRIEKKILFRVKDNPVVLRWGINWASYATYIRGMTYNLSVNKYPLGILRN
jgi:hypothetical protein